jgi:hypothetical protein
MLGKGCDFAKYSEVMVYARMALTSYLLRVKVTMATIITLMVDNYSVDVAFVTRYVCDAIGHKLHSKDLVMFGLREKGLLILRVHGQSFFA